ncbi:MAG: cation:proton antiporter [Candidatus Nitrosocaldaceae archaeon]
MADEFITTIITVCIFLFAAKILAEAFHRIKLPIVLGELLAGMIAGPFALGSLLIFNDDNLIQLNEPIKIIGEIGAIVILFIAGMEITPKEFIKGGVASFIVGSAGVIVPFFMSYFIFNALGHNELESLLIGTALSATSIAITIQVLTHIGKFKTPEAKIILGAAIVDDILALAVLSIVTSMVRSGSEIAVTDIVLLILKILGIFAALLISSIILLPRIVARVNLWKSEGSIEAIATASMFGVAAAATLAGLSPIVGAFAAGMALTTTNIVKRLEEYVAKLEFVFAPLFFAIIGAQVVLTNVSLNIFFLTSILLVIAIISKIIGCGLPSLIFLKNWGKASKVGIGMVSRGEVGLIVAGIGASSGIVSGDLYTALILTVAITTIVTPLLLNMAYKKEIVRNE